MPSEKQQITDKIMTWLRSRDHWCVKIHGEEMQERGTPDLLACIFGRFVAVEVKLPGNDASILQRYQLDLIRKAEGLALVSHSLRECQEQLRAAGLAV